MAVQQSPPPALEPVQNHSQLVIRRKIWKRMNIENEHFMGAIVGREGHGKSLSAISIARMVDPQFTADSVFFDPQNLIETFDSSEYGRGRMIILDEAGVGMGNRSWYEKEQILLNQVLQTVRDENMGVLFTLPRLEELDSQTEGRLHALIEMLGVADDGSHASAKWKNISMSRDGRGKEYKKYPRFRINGAKRKVREIAVGPPPESIEEAYEQQKAAFKQELYEEAMEAYDDEDEEKSEPDEVAQQVIDSDRVDEFTSIHPQNKSEFVDQDLLRSEFNLSVRDAKTAKKLIEKNAA
jgi:hypothetical protein